MSWLAPPPERRTVVPPTRVLWVRLYGQTTRALRDVYTWAVCLIPTSGLVRSLVGVSDTGSLPVHRFRCPGLENNHSDLESLVYCCSAVSGRCPLAKGRWQPLSTTMRSAGPSISRRWADGSTRATEGWTNLESRFSTVLGHLFVSSRLVLVLVLLSC